MLVIRTRHPDRLTSMYAFGVVPVLFGAAIVIGLRGDALSAVALGLCVSVVLLRGSMVLPETPVDRWGRRLPRA